MNDRKHIPILDSSFPYQHFVGTDTFTL